MCKFPNAWEKRRTVEELMKSKFSAKFMQVGFFLQDFSHILLHISFSFSFCRISISYISILFCRFLPLGIFPVSLYTLNLICRRVFVPRVLASHGFPSSISMF